MRRTALFLLAAFLAAPVCAAGGEGDRAQAVEAAVAKVRAKAAALDANGDGWLSETETSRGHATLGLLYGAVARRVDANGDGRIAVAEYVQAQEQALVRADSDHDGWITPAEAGTAKRKLVLELLTGG